VFVISTWTGLKFRLGGLSTPKPPAATRLFLTSVKTPFAVGQKIFVKRAMHRRQAGRTATTSKLVRCGTEPTRHSEQDRDMMVLFSTTLYPPVKDHNCSLRRAVYFAARICLAHHCRAFATRGGGCGQCPPNFVVPRMFFIKTYMVAKTKIFPP